MSNKYGTFSDSKSITLTWENINVNVPLKKPGLFNRKPKIHQKNSIIQDVSGIAKPGQVMAIMGASGAGKTTLLNVLTCRSNGNLKMDGSVKLNGTFITSASDIASFSGYVQQDDLFLANLRVREHITFQAMLRMDSDVYSKNEKYKRIEQVLNDLNLTKCENNLIGDPELGKKGISGGERRRLAFASEIITDPPLLFCDEPTSGLDSFMAMTIVESLKKLASQGKTIVCTIHQPSSEIFRGFDTLYLMAEGRLAYSGPLNSAFDFFTSQGFICPSNFNPAEFYINKLAISPFKREECIATVKKICEGFDKSTYREQMRDDIESIKKDSNIEERKFKRNKYNVGSFSQLKWLMWRDSKNTYRDPRETQITFIQTILFAVFFGLIYLQITLDQTGVQNINGVIFLVITNTTFSNLFPVLNSFPLLLPIFYREHKSRMYRTINFYLSKTLIDLPRFIIIPFTFITIVYWMAGLNDNPDRYLILGLVGILVANSTTAFGSLISALAPNVNIALAIAGPILTPLMIFGGFFLNSESIPVYFDWIKYLSWITYANDIALVNQWNGVKNIACEYNDTICYKNGEEVLQFSGANKDNYYRNFILLGVLIVSYRLLAFLVILAKSRRK